MTKLLISLTDEHAEATRQLAARTGQSVSSLAEKALRDALVRADIQALVDAGETGPNDERMREIEATRGS